MSILLVYYGFNYIDRVIGGSASRIAIFFFTRRPEGPRVGYWLGPRAGGERSAGPFLLLAATDHARAGLRPVARDAPPGRPMPATGCAFFIDIPISDVLPGLFNNYGVAHDGCI